MACAARWFIVDDVDMLEDDVQLLKRLFYADGEGLPSQRIIDLCAPLTAVLIVMQLDTGILIANFKQVCHLHAKFLHLIYLSQSWCPQFTLATGYRGESTWVQPQDPHI